MPSAKHCALVVCLLPGEQRSSVNLWNLCVPNWGARSDSGRLLGTVVIMCCFPVKYKQFKLIYRVVFWLLCVLCDSLLQFLIFGFLWSWCLGGLFLFCASDQCFGLIFPVIAASLCKFACLVWCWTLCHTVGNNLVVACCYFMLILLLRFPLILLQKTESSTDGILLKKGIINLSVVLLFWLYHLVRFSLAISPRIQFSDYLFGVFFPLIP